MRTVRVTNIRWLVLALLIAAAVFVLAIPASAHYQSASHSESISGVTLRTSFAMDHGSGMYWGTTYASASRILNSVGARSRGREYCNFVGQTDWDVTRWGYNREWAGSSGSGGMNTDWWDCLLMHDIVSGAWGYFRKSSNPYIYQNNGQFWVCEHLNGGYCAPKIN